MINNYVKEATTSPGTGTITLGGATAPFNTFAARFSTGAVVFYWLYDSTQWETGFGTLTHGSPNTLTRTTVIANSAGTTSKLNFAGATTVYNQVPAQRMAYFDDASVFRVFGGTRFFASCVVKITSNESIATATNTDIPWDAVEYDDAAIWSAGSPTRLTVPSGQGFTRARATGQNNWAGNATGQRIVRVFKNGAGNSGLGLVKTVPNATLEAALNVASNQVEVTGGDYFTLNAYQNSGGALNLLSAGEETWFGLELYR